MRTKLLLFMLFAIVAFASCKKDDPAILSEITFTGETIPTPELSSAGGMETITFKSTLAWTAEVEKNKTWCRISPTSGEAGKTMSIKLTVDPNETYDERTAEITITSEGKSIKFTLTQLGDTPPTPETPVIEVINPLNKKLELANTENATATVTFDSKSAGWEAAVKESDSWCVIDGDASGDLGSGKTITVKATSANTETTARRATVTITPAGGTAVKITVMQVGAGQTPTDNVLVSITAPSAITAIENGTTAATIVSALPIEVTMVTNDGNVQATVTWTTPTTSTYNPATTTAQTFNVAGTVTLPNGVVNTNTVALSTTVSVTVDAEVVVVPPTTDKVLVSITAPSAITAIENGTATATIVSGLPTEVTMVTNDGNLQANVAWTTPTTTTYNPATITAQTFNITGAVTLPNGVVNTNTVALSTTVSVTVDAEVVVVPPTPTITLTSQSDVNVTLLSAADSKKVVEFNSNVGWEAAVTAGSAWCTVAETSGDAGTKTITIKATTANPTTTARTTTVIITPTDGTAVTITVTQEGSKGGVDDMETKPW